MPPPRLTSRCLAVAVIAAAGCHDAPRSSGDPAPREPGLARSVPGSDAGGPAATPRAWPSGVPDRDACRSHDECTVIVWDGPVPPDPCCDRRVGYQPVARAYLGFFEAYRKTHCDGVTCPTPPFPGAEPACCASIGRCVAQHCVSACDDPTAHVPSGSVLDPTCNMPVPTYVEPCNAAATPKAYAGTAAAGALAQLTTCCASLRRHAPTMEYGAPHELTEAADVCDEIAARLANGCAPSRLADLKQQLRGKRVPGCKLR